MATFTVTQDDLDNAVTFLEQFLTAKLPEYDFSEGTANRDIAINSVAYITAFFRNEISNVKNRQSLLKLGELDDTETDDSVDEVVDEILSDWFITRKTGSYAGGYATLRFSRKNIGVITYTQQDLFKRSGKYFIIPIDSYTIQPSDLTKNTDNLGVTYYTATIPLIAQDVGADYEVEPGPFEDYPQSSPYLLGVRNIEKFAGGKGKETSEEMINRSASAITVRDLTVYNSIKTVLADEFSQIQEVYPIGMSDPEMIRDKLDVPRGTGNTVVIHRGSMIDIYAKLPVEFSNTYSAAYPSEGGLTAQQYTVDGSTITAVKLPSFPIYKIRSLLDTSVDPAVEVPFTIVTDSIDLWNSRRQNIYLQVGSAYNGSVLDLVYDTVTGYSSVQDYVEEERNRVIVADLLVKASFALYLKFELRYYPSATGIEDTTEVETALQEFIHGRVLGEEFRVSEITEKFVTDFPGNVVQLPLVVVGELLLPNGKVLTMNYEDRIRVPEKYYYDEAFPNTLYPLYAGESEPEGKVVVVLSDLQVSQRTMRFVAAQEDIDITAV